MTDTPVMAASMAAPDLRTREILDGARRAFAEKGFDAASMQDLARAAGMSAGNFYRYFPSKNAIVAAMIERDLAEVERDFAAVDTSDRPLDALRAIIRRRVETLECSDGPLWAEMEAAAQRRPDIADQMRRLETEIGSYLAAVFARVAGISPDEAAQQFAAHGALVVLLVKGAAIRLSSKACALSPEARADLLDLICATIDRTLDDITHSKPRDCVS